MAAGRRARRAGAVLALALAAFAACGRGDDIPPVPEELRRLEQREAGCIACHDGREAPQLAPGQTATPSRHPPVAVLKVLRSRDGFLDRPAGQAVRDAE